MGQQTGHHRRGGEHRRARKPQQRQGGQQARTVATRKHGPDPWSRSGYRPRWLSATKTPKHNNFATHLAHVFLQKFVQRRRPRGYGGRTYQIKLPTSFRAGVAVASQRARGFSDIAEAAAPNVACGQRLGLPPFSGRNMPATKSDTPT